ncbi:MAG: hypothetical protein WC879_03755 [Melioribacteraceae bacterium]
MDTQKFEFVNLVFTTAIEDIRFYKNQQWKITNYGLIVYAAIYSAYRLLELNNVTSSNCTRYCLFTIFAILLTLLTMGLASWLLWETNSSIKLARTRLEYCKKKYEEIFGVFYNDLLIPQSFEKKNELADQFMIMFYSVLVLGALIVITLICYKLS